MDISTAPSLLAKLPRLIKSKKIPSLTINFSEVTYFDDYGALVLFELKNTIANLKFINVSNNINDVLNIVNFNKIEKKPSLKKYRSFNIFVRMGESLLENALSVKYFISFIGGVILSLIYVFFRPKSLRYNDMITCMEKTGVEAIPIVGLISFLLGLIMAFMSSLQLKQFGANIYVASLVALAMVSELGPIMTAIIVAGRSGSAFAAEIGTMKISEEIDALYIMGFDTTLFLAVPRILGTVIVVPVLTLFSDVFAIAGGLVIGVTMLDLSATSYISQTLNSLSLFEVIWGLIKSAVFAFIIAWVGCLRGFETKGGAAGVGNAATSAVVTSIFLIILFDSIFAVIRSYW
ncbi:MAG: MlaE family lipid ABC transporter permease subunit [Desulfobacterales bacterium]|nr:MlaE family lipid ABC transporter permease subunit [Desulfobacterales bacterium]